MLDGEATDGGTIEDDATTMKDANGNLLCYEPDLNNFSYATEIVYYSQDLQSEKTMPIKEYMEEEKPKTIEGGNYIFCNYSTGANGENRIWANVKTKSNGLEAYWVWIPRYAYKLNATTKTAEIVFIDVENVPMNKELYGETLSSEYTVHPVFAENTGLKGIWFSKYKPSHIESVKPDTTEVVPNLSNFKSADTELVYYTADGSKSMSVEFSLMPSQTVTGENGETYYFYNYEKKIWANVKTKSNGLEAYWVWIPRFAYKLESGTSLVLLIDENNKPLDKATYGEEIPQGYTVHPAFEQDKTIKGLWFSKYKPSFVETKTDDGENAQKPDLSNFSSADTELVYYTADGNKSLTKPFSSNPDVTVTGEDGQTYYFYKYDSKIWANIKTKHDGAEAYWVWIPRFAYKLESGTANVILIDNDNKPLNTEVYGNTLPSGYTVHEAFVQDGNLKGIWFSKYKPSKKQ